MNDVVILSESYAIVRYAGPYVAAKSARDAGYKIKILDHITKHPDLIEYTRPHISPKTKLVVISTTFLYSNAVNRVAGWNLFSQFNLNFHFANSDELREFFANLRKLLPANCKIALAGEHVNKIYNFYQIIEDDHPLKQDVDLYFLGRDDNVLLNFLEGKNYETKFDKFVLGSKSDRFKLETPPTMIYTTDDCIIDEYESLTIEISRGCAFNCKYCNYDKKTVNKLEKDVLRDQFLKYHDLYGTTNYNFTTDCFNDNIGFVNYFYEMTQNLPFKIQWSGYARPDLCVRYPEVVDMMVESGAISNFYGVETLNRDVGKKIGRGLDFERILEVFSRFKKLSPDYFIKAFFIIGLPGETQETIQHAINWIGKQTIIDAASAQSLELEPTFDDVNLLMDVSEFSTSPDKYGFKEVSFKPEQYWRHDTMDKPTADALLVEWTDAANSNKFMANTSAMSIAELQSFKISSSFKDIIQKRQFDLLLKIGNQYRDRYYEKILQSV